MKYLTKISLFLLLLPLCSLAQKEQIITLSHGVQPDPIIVVDKKPFYGAINEIDQSIVTNVTVIRNSRTAVRKYGPKAEGGVVEITTNEPPKSTIVFIDHLGNPMPIREVIIKKAGYPDTVQHPSYKYFTYNMKKGGDVVFKFSTYDSVLIPNRGWNKKMIMKLGNDEKFYSLEENKADNDLDVQNAARRLVTYGLDGPKSLGGLVFPTNDTTIRLSVGWAIPYINVAFLGKDSVMDVNRQIGKITIILSYDYCCSGYQERLRQFIDSLSSIIPDKLTFITWTQDSVAQFREGSHIVPIEFQRVEDKSKIEYYQFFKNVPPSSITFVRADEGRSLMIQDIVPANLTELKLLIMKYFKR